METIQVTKSRQIVLLEQEDTFVIPTNCWAFVEEEGKQRLVQGLEVKGSEVQRLTLVPKVAGG